jgi:hypothetical protein
MIFQPGRIKNILLNTEEVNLLNRDYYRFHFNNNMYSYTLYFVVVPDIKVLKIVKFRTFYMLKICF